MKSLRNQIKQTFPVMVLCLSLVLFYSCQTSENDIVFSSEVLLTKDSKIVPLFLKALGEDPASSKSFAKSITQDQQCTEFVYPMTFYAYTNDDTVPTAVVINNDDEFVDFLTALTSGEQFFITYPVTILDVDGIATVINDYPDLEGILTMLVDACTEGDDGTDDDDDSDNDDDGSDDGNDSNDDDDDSNDDDDDSNDDNDDSGDDDDDSGDDDDSDDDDDEIDYEYCGNKNNKKVVICHNGQTICISINAIWGHMAHHSDDYFGSCNN